MGVKSRFTEMDNRFSTMTEVRRTAWPYYEKPEWSERRFLQGIAGTLELFHLSIVRFQNLSEKSPGHPVMVYQRVDQAGQRLPMDERILGRHRYLNDLRSRPSRHGRESRPGGDRGDPKVSDARRNMPDHGATPRRGRIRRPETAANGIRPSRGSLVPRQQRFTGYGRSLMKGLGIPVENRLGASSRIGPGTKQIAPLTAIRDLDTRGWLTGVTTFNFHPHCRITR